jgi:aryl-alcohol dehydrogenase-like predicted oxidoreductase
MQVPHQRLGRSGLTVSRLVLGTMMFGDRTDEGEAARIIDDALENGVNFIDTADVYNAAAPRRSSDARSRGGGPSGCSPPNSATQ